jgi:MFS family permease
LFVFAGSAALTVLVFRRTDAQKFALAGCGLMIVGVALVLAAVPEHAPVLFFAGTAIAGAGFGPGFQGGLRTIVPLAGPTERAGVIAVIYLISYLALGLPAIGAGVLVVHSTVSHTAVLFGLGVIGLAATTGGALVVKLRRDHAEEPAAQTRRCLAVE